MVSPGAMQTQRADPVLLRSDVPDRPEPQPQRLTCVLEDRAGGHRRLPPAASAFEPHFAHRPSPLMPASRTAETLRPAQRGQIVATGLFAGEACLELEQVAWIILHEGAYYILGSPESSGYPIYRQFDNCCFPPIISSPTEMASPSCRCIEMSGTPRSRMWLSRPYNASSYLR